MTFVLTGNFTQHAVMAGGGASGGSVEYKEYFDSLASVLSDFPTLLQTASFVFVPGDNDGWASSFSAGAAVPLPRKPVPDMFTSRIRRAFATANAEPGVKKGGEAIWASNPARLSVFGPTHEMVLFRDDMSARLRRTAVRLRSSKPSSEDQENQASPNESVEDVDMTGALHDQQPVAEAMDVDAIAAKPTTPEIAYDVQAARKLVKTVLDQGYLAPFRQQIRPVHWDYASALHLYPLPTAMVLVDATAPPFCITYEGCHVMNPGTILVAGRRGVGRWVEYELGGKGRVRECMF
jgi:DNA polymerase epsilon subunit 2